MFLVLTKYKVQLQVLKLVESWNLRLGPTYLAHLTLPVSKYFPSFPSHWHYVTINTYYPSFPKEAKADSEFFHFNVRNQVNYDVRHLYLILRLIQGTNLLKAFISLFFYFLLFGTEVKYLKRITKFLCLRKHLFFCSRLRFKNKGIKY